MGTFKGKRIIPKHDGVWDQKKEYEELTIVLDAESGDGYISRKPVPAGTVLSPVRCSQTSTTGQGAVISMPRCTDWKRMLQKMWKECTGIFRRRKHP